MGVSLVVSAEHLGDDNMVWQTEYGMVPLIADDLPLPHYQIIIASYTYIHSRLY